MSDHKTDKPVSVREALGRLVMAARAQVDHWEHQRKDMTATLDEAGVAQEARDRWERLANDGENALAALSSPDDTAERLATRDDRQRVVAGWCAAAFGTDHANSVPQRALRLLEEAIEAYQAAGCDEAMAQKLVAFVFARPSGEIGRELGGVGLCLLAMANALGVNADQEEARELARVLAKPLSHFTARNAAKNAAGFEIAKAAPPKDGT